MVKDIIVSVLSIFGVSLLCASLTMVINYLKTTTKSERVQIALQFALQAVVMAERTAKPGPDKKQIAMATLDKRLKENGMSKFINAQQIEQYIEQAVSTMQSFDFERNVVKDQPIEVASSSACFPNRQMTKKEIQQQALFLKQQLENLGDD